MCACGSEWGESLEVELCDGAVAGVACLSCGSGADADGQVGELMFYLACAVMGCDVLTGARGRGIMLLGDRSGFLVSLVLAVVRFGLGVLFPSCAGLASLYDLVLGSLDGCGGLTVRCGLVGSSAWLAAMSVYSAYLVKGYWGLT